MRIVKALAGLAAPLPAILDASDAALIKGDGPARALGFPLDPRLPPHDGDEDGNREGNGPEVRLAAHGEGDEHDDGGDGDEAEIADPVAAEGQGGEPSGALRKPLGVSFARRSVGVVKGLGCPLIVTRDPNGEKNFPP